MEAEIAKQGATVTEIKDGEDENETKAAEQKSTTQIKNQTVA